MSKRFGKLLALMTALIMVFAAVPVMADSASPQGNVISGITVSKAYGYYNGAKQKATKFVVKDQDGNIVDKDYYVAESTSTSSAKPGTYTLKVTVTGKGKYTGNLAMDYKYTIKKATPTLKVSTAKKTVKYSKKKTRYSSKVSVKGAKGTVTYKKLSGNKKISIGKKTGKFAVKKGTKKGTYKIKVKVTSASTKYYNSKSKTVYIKVRVK